MKDVVVYAGRACNKDFVFTSALRNSVISCTAVPNSPDKAFLSLHITRGVLPHAYMCTHLCACMAVCASVNSHSETVMYTCKLFKQEYILICAILVYIGVQRLACNDKNNDWKAAIDLNPPLASLWCSLGRDLSTSFICCGIFAGYLVAGPAVNTNTGIMPEKA